MKAALTYCIAMAITFFAWALTIHDLNRAEREIIRLQKIIDAQSWSIDITTNR